MKNGKRQTPNCAFVTNVNPTTRKGKTVLVADGSTNCGRKARKNRDTFGFKTFVTMPSLYIAR